MKPYLVFNDGHSDPSFWGPPGPDSPPTSSPPLMSLEGGVDFRLYSNQSTPVSPL